MVASLQNSQIICRQVPHGGVSDSVSATIAMALNLRSPSDSAFQMATRSAQTVSPKLALSMLQPVYTLPSSVSTAAPTLNFENAATDCSRAAVAAAISASNFESIN